MKKIKFCKNLKLAPNSKLDQKKKNLWKTQN